MNEYNIYIIVSKTNTIMGKLIRAYSRFDYNHVSISINNNLQPMYSFARYFVNETLVGGFVEESWLRYLYNKKNIQTKIYCINVSKKAYIELKYKLEQIKTHRKQYIYDTFGVRSNTYQLGKNQHKYTCLSFAKKILYDINVLDEMDSIKDIHSLCNQLERYYIGDYMIMAKYCYKYQWGNDEFYKRKSFFCVIIDTIKHLNRALLAK